MTELGDGDGDPVSVARANARLKAAAAGGGDDVLAVDTLVALDGAIYGKPVDRDAARSTLTALAGRTHTVVSGLVLGELELHAETAVTMGTGLVDWYLEEDEWRERAGAYAIQGRGAALVERIAGDHANVVGLPVAALLAARPDLLTGGR